MQTSIKKHITSFLNCLLILTMVIALIPAVPGEAASQRSKALSCYKKLLEKSTVYVIPKGVKESYDLYYTRKYKGTKRAEVQFSLGYINSDNIPDLVLTNDDAHYGVWTYRNGKMICLTYCADMAEPTGYYRKKCLFVDYQYDSSSMYSRGYYRKSNGTLRQFLEIRASYDDGSAKYYKTTKRRDSGKRISKAQFNKSLKKYIGSTKLTKITMHKNTSKNRSKYIR